jgi:retron-type reverse transcriptase
MHQAQKYISDGYTFVVDIDLEKFFDKVNHDRLMSALAKRIEDKRMLKIIRAYLKIITETQEILISQEADLQTNSQFMLWESEGVLR